MYGQSTQKERKALPISEEAESEKLLSDTENSEPGRKPRRDAFSRCRVALLFLPSLCIAALLGTWVGGRLLVKTDYLCAARASQYCKTNAKVVVVLEHD